MVNLVSLAVAQVMHLNTAPACPQSPDTPMRCVGRINGGGSLTAKWLARRRVGQALQPNIQKQPWSWLAIRPKRIGRGDAGRRRGLLAARQHSQDDIATGDAGRLAGFTDLFTRPTWTNVASGLRWLSAMLLVKVSWADRIMALTPPLSSKSARL